MHLIGIFGNSNADSRLSHLYKPTFFILCVCHAAHSSRFCQASILMPKLALPCFLLPRGVITPPALGRGAHLVSQNAEFQQATAVPGIAEATGRRAQICERRDFLWGLGRRL